MTRLTLTLIAASALSVQQFPETAKDSESIRDEQYRQMDRYFEEQIARSAEMRARYWDRLDFSSASQTDDAVTNDCQGLGSRRPLIAGPYFRMRNDDVGKWTALRDCEHRR